MTWVIGMRTMFGYSIGLSDVRVTAADGQFMDCLQKVYPVGRDIILGFAGSVSIGFKMVRRMATLMSQAPADQGWDPLAVADWWPADARESWEGSTLRERSDGCHLMMLSAHPNLNAGAAPWPMNYVHVFRAPDFAAEEVAPMATVSIGYGAGESGCVEALRDLTATDKALDELVQAAAIPNGIAMALGIGVHEYIRTARPDTISPHLNICSVTRQQMYIGNNDYTRHEGGKQTPFVMPRLARSLEELAEIWNTPGESMTGMTC